MIQRNQQFHHDVIALAPFERGEESKTGVFDEVLILDDVRMPCLGEVVVQLAKNRIRQEGEAAHLWTFSAKQYLDVWRSCVMTLGLEEIAESRYQNRHGGASRDHLLRLRSVAAIQRRGRWSSDNSARIYDKPGRLQQLINKVSAELEPFGENMRMHFRNLYLGGKVVLPRKVKERTRQFFK